MKKQFLFLMLVMFSLTISVNAQENAGLTLPQGFKANVFAQNLGSPRHIAITSKGVLFAKLNYPNKEGKSIVRLEDTNGDGVADKIGRAHV